MNAQEPPAYGPWPLVFINAALFILFAFSFTKPRTARDWRSFGAGFDDVQHKLALRGDVVAGGPQGRECFSIDSPGWPPSRVANARQSPQQMWYKVRSSSSG